jgi:hypothetical protein
MFTMDLADQFIAGNPDADDAAISDRINLVTGTGGFVLFVTVAIVFIRWLFVAHASDRMNPDAQKHKSGDATDLQQFGEDLRTASEADLASSVLDIVAAVFALLVVRQLTRLVREAPVVW